MKSGIRGKACSNHSRPFPHIQQKSKCLFLAAKDQARDYAEAEADHALYPDKEDPL